MAGDGADAAESKEGEPAAADGAGTSDPEDPRVRQPRSSPPVQARPTDSDFDWRGWLLVGIIVLCFLVIPAAILYLPQAQSLVASFGLSLRDAYLVLPLVPAFLLGAVAVWAAVKSRSPQE